MDYTELIVETMHKIAQNDPKLFGRLLFEMMRYIHHLSDTQARALDRELRSHFRIDIGATEEQWSAERATCHTSTPVSIWYAGRKVIATTEDAYWCYSDDMWQGCYTHYIDWDMVAKVANILRFDITTITKAPEAHK
jgi:hypothetical protein